MNDPAKTRQWLYEAMKENKKTAQDVAIMADICVNRIRAYVSGAGDLDLKELQKLSTCLKTSLPV